MNTKKAIFTACLLATMVLADTRPNFIFFITDDISPDDLGPYGNTFVQTPNLDRIARRGLVFDSAYNVISSCSPSRCSIITGRYPHNTGAPELHTGLPTDQKTFVQALRDAGYYTVISGKNHINKNHGQLGFDQSSDSKPAGSENWVEELRNRPKDKPFFFWFGSHDAHYPWETNDKAPVYDPAKVPVPPMLFDGPEMRKALALYYHEVSRSDHYAGQIMAELEAQGLAQNTYFVYCADNGRPFARCKTYLYESGIRTPLIIAGPGVVSGRTGSLASSIDYAPTFLELAGVEKMTTLQGTSLVPTLRNPAARVRDVVFAERNWHVFQLHERMVRMGDWLYIWNAWPDRYNVCDESAGFRFAHVKEMWDAAADGQLTDAQKQITLPNQPPEMLFNVKQDPHQFVNLAGNPEYAEVMQRMRGLLNRWKDETHDSVQKNPTPNCQPLHGMKTKGQNGIPESGWWAGSMNWKLHGEFPGEDRDAARCNAPGPVKL